ncbi:MULTISPECIES: GNAT family N-acetyltransferase [unclassified Paenibacillus]|uniref:GNAT family N-acetyltransferase n=1 Tax=Paenibacillus provencensis TaxID=441151 RepID=A0ABW3Q2A4_9BACL|nr:MULTISPECIES: GNAT family N-acetyltransferase [unclassified Paenibacillus]MCM3128912.1 GNAT family N-acetyltransferase [Paenibacillus sp. MER 78]SFS50076.1 Acetyltransferase (GNAT) domain-containing protein [Paenibacillus sp. 453mf]
MADIYLDNMCLSTDREAASDYEDICRKLHGYNMRATDGLLKEPGDSIHLYLKNEAKEVVGGIFCETWLYGLYIDVFWIAEAYRSKGLGHQMLCEAERRGREVGCLFAHTSTFSYQAPLFYEKNGYEVYAINNLFPGEIKQYFLKKKFETVYD